MSEDTFLMFAAQIVFIRRHLRKYTFLCAVNFCGVILKNYFTLGHEYEQITFYSYNVSLRFFFFFF